MLFLVLEMKTDDRYSVELFCSGVYRSPPTLLILEGEVKVNHIDVKSMFCITGDTVFYSLEVPGEKQMDSL